MINNLAHDRIRVSLFIDLRIEVLHDDVCCEHVSSTIGKHYLILACVQNCWIVLTLSNGVSISVSFPANNLCFGNIAHVWQKYFSRQHQKVLYCEVTIIC